MKRSRLEEFRQTAYTHLSKAIASVQATGMLAVAHQVQARNFRYHCLFHPINRHFIFWKSLKAMEFLLNELQV